MQQSNKPFSQDFVIKTTLKNMQKAIDISVNKTLSRVSEFADNPEKSNEIFMTLGNLQTMKKSLENIQIYESDKG